MHKFYNLKLSDIKIYTYANKCIVINKLLLAIFERCIETIGEQHETIYAKDLLIHESTDSDT